MYMNFENNFEEIRDSLESDIRKAYEVIRYIRYFISKAKSFSIAIRFMNKDYADFTKAILGWENTTIYLAAFNNKFSDTKFDGVKKATSIFVNKFRYSRIEESKYCGLFQKDYYLMGFLLSEYEEYLNALFYCNREFKMEFAELRKILAFLKQRKNSEIDELELLEKNITKWMNALRNNVQDIKKAICYCAFSGVLYKPLLQALSTVFDYVNKSYENEISRNLYPDSWQKNFPVPKANFTGVINQFEALTVKCGAYNNTTSLMIGMLLKVILMSWLFLNYNESTWNALMFYEDQEKFEIREQSKKTIKDLCTKMNIYLPGINNIQGLKIYGGI